MAKDGGATHSEEGSGNGAGWKEAEEFSFRVLSFKCLGALQPCCPEGFGMWSCGPGGGREQAADMHSVVVKTTKVL